MGQVEQFEHIADDLLSLRATDLISHGEEIEELPDLHPVVDPEVIGHIADATTNIHRLFVDAKAVDGAIPACALEKGRKKSNRGALARSVGPDEAKEFTGLDLHVDRRDCGEFSVVFPKVD